jgi:hypothetical protein
MTDHVKKPVLSYVAVSKTCGEPRRTIENPKSLGDSAECAGESRSSNQMILKSKIWPDV